MISRLGSVDHMGGTGGNANVVNTLSIAVEHQVTSLVLAVGNVMAVLVRVLSGGHASDLLVRTMEHGVLGQARAVEAYRVGTAVDSLGLAILVATAPRVGDANLRARSSHNGLAVTPNWNEDKTIINQALNTPTGH